MADNNRHIGSELGASLNTVFLQFFAQRLKDSKNNIVHIGRLSSLIVLLEQGANAIKYVTRTMPVAYHPVQSGSYFIMIGRHLSKKSQGGVSVRYQSGQGLSNFMGNRSRNGLHVQQLIFSLALQLYDCFL